METFTQQLIDLFTSPPGNLIYHIVLAFAITAAIQGVLISRRAGQVEFIGRALFGLGLILVGQVFLFLVSGLAWQGLVNPHIYLPPLDRAVTFFSLVWIIWLWAYPRPDRLADGLAGILSLIVAIAFFFTLNVWASQPPSLVFNGWDLDFAWELATLGLLLAGSLVLALRRPDGWGVGLGFILVNLTGHTLQFLWPSAGGDFSGIVRLAQLGSYPLLPALAQRMIPAGLLQSDIQPGVQFKVVPPNSEGDLKPGVMRERRRYSADPRAVQAWLDVATQTDPEHKLFTLTRAVAQTMLADICFFVADPGDNNELVFACGYDLIREDEIPEIRFNRDQLPAVASSLQRGRSYRLEPGSNTPDLRNLAERFGLKSLGSLLFLPLSSQQKRLGGFLMLSPYSDRTWTVEDQNYLTAALEPLAQILQPPAPGGVPASLATSDAEMDALRQQVEQARQENLRLKDDLERLRQQPASMDLESLILIQKESQETIAALRAENERLKAGTQTPAAASQAQPEELSHPEEVQYLENELRKSLKEAAHLQNRLAEANMQILTLQKQVSQPVRMINEEREVVASIAQELRQPMASIIGYTDLLLAESAGILGALQRKFLDRVKASIDRMRSILDDLVAITAVQHDMVESVAQSVPASQAIDEALTETRAQLQEKNIVMQVDLPDELPELQADPDAIQQILVHLLQNAGAATPIEGTISLKVRMDLDNSVEPYLLFQITDSGGGIAPEDLPKVFTRRYRSDTALIQGLGDSGVGLSIAKALTEAHRGRIWVESEAGKGATFSVLIPVQTKLSTETTETVG